MHVARRDAATWVEIAAVLKASVEQVRREYAEVLERQERILGRDVSTYREAL